MKPLITLALVFAVLGSAVAQQPGGMPGQPDLDFALEAARARARAATSVPQTASPGASMPRVDMERIKELGGGADPMEVARKYQQQQQTAGVSPEMLYVFVSTSLNVSTLKQLAMQTKAAKGVLVLRGIKGGFAGYAQLVKDFEPVIATGADIQIHPELFDRFNVTAVPTFVIAASEEGCIGTACNAEAISVAGDVSLPYALDHLRSRAHPLAKIAQRYRASFP